jgi:hypothetical protein
MIVKHKWLVRISIKFNSLLKEEKVTFGTGSVMIMRMIPWHGFMKGKVAHSTVSRLICNRFIHSEGIVGFHNGFIEAGITFISTAFIMTELCTIIPVETI